MSRILIFTGKGGVGKTSVAAAHARNSAKEGKKTLLVSTDMAHNVSDLFGVNLGKKETEVSENLFALEIDPNQVMEHDFPDMMRAFYNVLHAAGLPMEKQEFVCMIPGMEELFSLMKIMAIHESGRYERIIIDCAPTGETLSLLKFPELLSWYMEKFFPVGRAAMRVLAPISKTAFKVELPDREAMNDIEKMYLRMISLQELLKNREITSIRLVTIPEKMVVEETKRNYMYMNLYNFNVDALYINRILPKDVGNAFFEQWIEIQETYMEELEAIFRHMDIYRIPWFETDVNGLPGIDRIDEEVLRGRDIFRIDANVQGERYEKLEGGYLLHLFLPCAEKGQLDLHESEMDIILKLGNFKRSIPKPNILRTYETVSARLEEEQLTIEFKKRS